MYEDNSACIEWGNHMIVRRERVKHIDISKHFAHETIQNRQMRLIKVETSSQLADIFTRPLQLQQFLAFRDGLLAGQSGQALPPRGSCDSGGGQRSSSRVAPGARMDAADIGLRGIEPLRPFGGVFASKDFASLVQGPSGVGRPSQGGRI